VLLSRVSRPADADDEDAAAPLDVVDLATAGAAGGGTCELDELEELLAAAG